MADEIKNSEKLVRILSGILAVAFVVVLILIKIANPDFKIGMLIFIIVLILLFFVGIVIGFHFWQKRKKIDVIPGGAPTLNQKLPPAITMEQARELARMSVVNPHYADYIPHCLGERNELLGKSVKSYIYAYKARGVYKKQIYCIVMNRHFPNETLNILINPDLHEINRAMMLAASHPEDESTKEQTVAVNELLGTTITTTKEIREKKAEEENKKKEDM